MNAKSSKYSKYIKFAMYVVIAVLVNMAGITLFFRADLTKNKVYSLSPISKKVAATLTEPLTVKVFFTKDLPAPYNTTELYLRDLLNEYALNNRKYFKVHFHNVSAETEGVSEEARENQQMARDYGIQPVQVQNVEEDEVKFKQAYMGLVLIHGDIIERIPTIASTDGLEYKLTTAIQKLNNKVSALLALDENINVTLVLSSSFYKVAPYINLQGMEQYPDKIKKLVEEMNARNYGKLSFQTVDPSSDPEVSKSTAPYDLMRLKWKEVPKAGIPAGEGEIGMLIQYKDKAREVPLLHVVRLPIFGDQYQLAELDEIEAAINTNLERLININEEVGYLAGYGTLELTGGGPLGPRGETADNFNGILNKTYSVKQIDLEESPIPEGLKSLIIARPTNPLSDWALYQIDQALMRGTNLAVFIDVLQEQQQNRNMMMGGQQLGFQVPLKTGLEKLLAHYGVRVKEAVVMDENCYRQRKPPQQGGGEQPIYFAPIIENEFINHDLDYLKNIKGVIGLQISPLELDDQVISDQKITAHKILSSSDRSWEMRDRIMLNPMFITPPASDKEMHSQPLAYLLEGSFTSYFKGKPMPEKPVEKKTDEGGEADEKNTADDAEKSSGKVAEVGLDKVQGTFREESAPAKILVIASSKMIGDQLIDQTGQSPNSVFTLNMIDALNGHEDVAAMRGKQQSFNPLLPAGTGKKFAIKAANMLGLPIVVILFGLIVWWRRHLRRKAIQAAFRSAA